ncbi:hypothetical protein COO91_04875 [Nostoc flagelliforme CCNUN1]|uniref:Uncharacterized protein n=1 Tax=Nostoc flagelliforme CCNUN1 TaxID=2038116 RepID=A0A2K8SU25_9NOSO|nr:hypothetical protein COO91_04875 [Nostoc flagelliforme CCNUN1]
MIKTNKATNNRRNMTDTLSDPKIPNLKSKIDRLIWFISPN